MEKKSHHKKKVEPPTGKPAEPPPAPELEPEAPREKKLEDRTETMLMRIHRNAAHCSNKNLARTLKDDGAPDWVVHRAENLVCDHCQATARPVNKPPVSITYTRRLWHTVGIDNAELERPDSIVMFSLFGEEASGMVVPQVLFEKNKAEFRNPTAVEVTDAFAEGWLSHYPKPVRVTTDPEGAFQSREFRDFLAANGILYEPTAGDAHFQLGSIERKIQTVKRIATKLAAEFPTMTGKQLLAAACAANNELERTRGYAPYQWSFGHAKSTWDDCIETPGESFQDVMQLRIRAQEHWLKEKAHQKLLIATRAKTRSLTTYAPGDKVLIWRSGKGTKTKPGWGGKWLGPAIVLMHQAPKVVWISLGGKLYRCAPEHLRQATEREGFVFDMNFPRMSFDPDQVLAKGEFEDCISDPKPTPDQVELEGGPIDSRDVPMSEPSTRTRGLDTAPESQQKKMRIKIKSAKSAQAEPREEQNLAPVIPTDYGKGVIQMVFHMDQKDIDKFSKNPENFIKRKFAKKAIEVSLRNLEGAELEEMEEAMAKELAEWLQEIALKTVQESELKTIEPERLLKIRWVLTYKPDPSSASGQKAKARMVILGYQHPELTEIETASPTLSRTGKHLVLQWAAINKATVEAADATSAFLQGDGQELDDNRPIYISATAEIAAALDVPTGTAVRTAKAVYGLGQAPRSWFFSVNRKLLEMGAHQLKSEPCVWRFCRPGDGTDTSVYAVVAAYVDDFLIAGDHTNPLYMKLRESLKQMYRWGGEWKRGNFVMCGVRITQQHDFSFRLDQTSYTHEKLNTIEVPKGIDRPCTEREISQLRGLNGGLQWKATQTGPQICASLNMLQSQVGTATLKNIREANDLVKYLKQQEFAIIIHSHNYVPWYDIGCVTWSDAAQGDRPDGKSTGGYVTCLGETSTALKGFWTDMSLVSWNTSKLPRVAKSSLAAEVQEACIAEDEAYLIRFIWGELNGCEGTSDEIVNAVSAILVTDAKALYDAVKSETSALGMKEKRSGIELLSLKENLKVNKTTLRWVNSGAMLADPMTKGKARHIMEEFLRNPVWKLVEDQKFTSFKKRKAAGGDGFEQPEKLPKHDLENIEAEAESSEDDSDAMKT